MGAGRAHLKSSFSSHFGRISTSMPFTSIAHITNSELYLLGTSHVSSGECVICTGGRPAIYLPAAIAKMAGRLSSYFVAWPCRRCRYNGVLTRKPFEPSHTISFMGIPVCVCLSNDAILAKLLSLCVGILLDRAAWVARSSRCNERHAAKIVHDADSRNAQTDRKRMIS